MNAVTAKQADYIRSLAGKKPLGEADKTLLQQLEAGTMTRRAASLFIDALQSRADALPREPQAEAKPGYYVTHGGDVFVVVINKAGTNTYAKRLQITKPDTRCGAGHGHYDTDGNTYFCADPMACDYSTAKTKAKWVYAPRVGASFADVEPLTVEEATRLSHMHGVCVICGRSLTKGKSVQAGIGPVCRKKVQAALLPAMPDEAAAADIPWNADDYYAPEPVR